MPTGNMSRFKGPAIWRPTPPARTNTKSSVRGKQISAPIPWPDDDEFPIRAPGTGIATPLGVEGNEKQLHIRRSTASGPDNGPLPNEGTTDSTDQTGTARSAPAVVGGSSQSSARQTAQPSTLRNSVVSTPPESLGNLQRKKSSLRSVLGRLFGRKRKSNASTVSGPQASDVRAGQHRSVSS